MLSFNISNKHNGLETKTTIVVNEDSELIATRLLKSRIYKIIYKIDTDMSVSEFAKRIEVLKMMDDDFFLLYEED